MRLRGNAASQTRLESEAKTRPQPSGKFFCIDSGKFPVCGVTYGPFRPGVDGCEYGARFSVDRDFRLMAKHGINAIRLFTAPPSWLLDMAAQRGIRVMMGVAWEQHVHFLDDRRLTRSVLDRVREAARTARGHSAALCFSVGNEIPAPIVRWYGPRRIERFIQRLYDAVKAEDPDLPVTYANYPTTEYLELPFLDVVCFNVYLERAENLGRYLARLHNIAGDRPLLLTELGLDSQSNGEQRQAWSLYQQVSEVFRSGGAGAFVFSWTDDWHRDGLDIENWSFGLTDRARKPKPALRAIRAAFASSQPAPDESWPLVSVIVCVKNGETTLRSCLEGVRRLSYPRLEIIVVDDGSTDGSRFVAERYADRVISTVNRGLGSARNTGLQEAAGEIVAYLDADAFPDPDWLTCLVQDFRDTSFVAIGGPNIAPEGLTGIAECVANAPGGPQHVLLDDRTAEHIPGCNMAFRREALLEVGGFDPQFRIAGDDIDVCWSLQEKGGSLGFSPAALVWHFPRCSIRAYWKQQFNYGRAEAMVERKWPEKYNRFGHLAWRGRLYGNGPILLSRRSHRIYHGVWGTGLFQTAESQSISIVGSLVHMPEWWLAVVVLLSSSVAGVFWTPLFRFFAALTAVAVCILLFQAFRVAEKVNFHKPKRTRLERIGKRVLTAGLYLLQPLARLSGRLSYDLSAGRKQEGKRIRLPLSRVLSCWSVLGRTQTEWLTDLEASLRSLHLSVFRGGGYDRWDLEGWYGMFGGIRLLSGIEEHGKGSQMFRVRVEPLFSWISVGFITLFSSLALLAALTGTWAAFALLAAIMLAFGLRALQEYDAAFDSVSVTVQQWRLREMEGLGEDDGEAEDRVAQLATGTDR